MVITKAVEKIRNIWERPRRSDLPIIGGESGSGRTVNVILVAERAIEAVHYVDPSEDTIKRFTELESAARWRSTMSKAKARLIAIG